MPSKSYLPIYLDYMATTPLDPGVKKAMLPYLDNKQYFGNPNSTHYYGLLAREAVEKAREQVSELINADPRSIIWTSGATEADNMALKGAAYFYQRSGKHIITSKIEHKAVLDCCHFLESKGFAVTYLEPESNGHIDFNKIVNAMRKDTILLSLMHANNEIGVINDIEKIGLLTRERGIIFHVDAAQSAGKIDIDLKKMPVDLMSFSSHKVYGPKGIGALYVSQDPRCHLEPIIHGGGQEFNLRSGTLPTHQIVGMGEAFAIAKKTMRDEQRNILQLRKKLLEILLTIPGIHTHGDLEKGLPGNLSVSFRGINGEELISALKDIAISGSAACAYDRVTPSHVLSAIGVKPEMAQSTLRLSWGRFTTVKEIIFAAKQIKTVIKSLVAL